MTSITAHTHLGVLDDDMEISSDIGRQAPNDDDIDIDIDFGDAQDIAHTDDSMIEDPVDTSLDHPFQDFTCYEDDEMVDEEESEGMFIQQHPDITSEQVVEDEELADAVLDETREGDIEIADERSVHYEEDLLDSIDDSRDLSQTLPESDLALSAAVQTAGSVAEKIAEAHDQHDMHAASSPEHGAPAANGKYLLSEGAVAEHIECQTPVLNAEDDHLDQLLLRDDDNDVAVPSISFEAGIESNSPHDAGEYVSLEHAAAESYASRPELDSNAAYTSATTTGQLVLAVDGHKCSVVLDFQLDFAQYILDHDMCQNMSRDELVIHKKLHEFLASCRMLFRDSMSDEEFLEVGIEQLGLSLIEVCYFNMDFQRDGGANVCWQDADQLSDFSLNEILEVYEQLCENDGIDEPEPLTLVVMTRPRFTTRMMTLSSLANAGHGLSQVVGSVLSAEEEDPETEEYDTNDGGNGDGLKPADTIDEVHELDEVNEHSVDDAIQSSLAVEEGLQHATETGDATKTTPDQDGGIQKVLGTRTPSPEKRNDVESPKHGITINGGAGDLTAAPALPKVDHDASHDDGLDDLLDFSAEEDEGEDERAHDKVTVESGEQVNEVGSSSGTATLEGDTGGDEFDQTELVDPSKHTGAVEEDEIHPEDVQYYDGSGLVEHAGEGHDYGDDHIDFPPYDEEYEDGQGDLTESHEEYLDLEEDEGLQHQAEEHHTTMEHQAVIDAHDVDGPSQFEPATKAELAPEAQSRKRSRGATELADEDSDGSTKKSRAV